MKKTKKLILAIFFTISQLFSQQKYQLSICTVIEKNESQSIKEWIEYHRLIGVDHFYIYYISRTMPYLEILRPYVKEGIVSLIRWQNLGQGYKDDTLIGLSTFVPAYENAVRYTAKEETTWLAIVELNEYIVPPFHTDLKEILDDYKELPGIIISSNYYHLYTSSFDALTIDNKELTPPPSTPIYRSRVKTIFKPDLVEFFLWPPYEFTYKNGMQPIALSKETLRINQYIASKEPQSNLQLFAPYMLVDPQILSDEEKISLLKAGYHLEDRERAISRFSPVLRQKIKTHPYTSLEFQ